MSLFDPTERPDPRERPADPAGTQPKVDPDSLVLHGRPEEATREQVDDRLEEAVDRYEELAEDATVGETTQAPRFHFLYGALLAVGLIALAGAVILLVAGTSGSGERSDWSSWRPSGDDPLQQIADHVAPQYHLPNGDQLVFVTGGPLQIASLPTQLAASTDGSSVQLVKGKTALFKLCGLGEQCAIAQGKPSSQRHLLLRREALELALYTFRYVDDVDQVVVLLPRASGANPDQAVLFRRGDVRSELARPLRATLSARTPSVAGMAASPDARVVDHVTMPALYRFSLTQAQDASVVLILGPLERAAAPPSKGTAKPAAPLKKAAKHP